MTSGQIEDLAREFWAVAGAPPPFPRDLAAILPRALPAAVVLLDALSLAAIEGWLARRGAPWSFGCPDRRLRGCLVAHAGHGLVFVDASDGDDERRFTLAHEASHLILDYLRLRRHAVDRLGEAIVDVLDGHRPPTMAERVDAVLAACPIGVHVHLLDRDGPAAIPHAAREDHADRLACELLAPRETLDGRFGGTSPGPADIAHDLWMSFGLPPAPAAVYAERWCRARRPPRSFVEWLRP